MGRRRFTSPHFREKCGQQGPKLGPKMEPKWRKKRCKNRSKIGCILELIFERVWEDFGSQNGAKLAPKLSKKSILYWKWCKAQNAYKTNGFLMICWFSGTEAGTKNRSKIDQKLKPKMDCLLASIFGGFWCQLGSILGPKIDQNSAKSDLKKR